jgi:transcriptional regulator with XRE-family HTH domain
VFGLPNGPSELPSFSKIRWIVYHRSGIARQNPAVLFLAVRSSRRGAAETVGARKRAMSRAAAKGVPRKRLESMLVSFPGGLLRLPPWHPGNAALSIQGAFEDGQTVRERVQAACLARNSKVKRASISEYEADLTNPDASTLEKLLGTMRFKWAALDLAGWFLTRLFTECRLSKGAFLEAAEPTALDAMAAEMSEMATKLRSMAETLRAQRQEEASSGGVPGAGPAEPSLEDRAAARPLVQRLRTLARPKQSAELREIPEGLRWAVCEILCLDSQRLSADDPARAAALAELALEAADLAHGGDTWRAKLRGLASAHLGNALRAGGDHEGGNRAFDIALASWEAGKDAYSGLLEEGLVYALKASLRRAERRFEEAADLLTRASAEASGVRFRVQVGIQGEARRGDGSARRGCRDPYKREHVVYPR